MESSWASSGESAAGIPEPSQYYMPPLARSNSFAHLGGGSPTMKHYPPPWRVDSARRVNSPISSDVSDNWPTWRENSYFERRGAVVDDYPYRSSTAWSYPFKIAFTLMVALIFGGAIVGIFFMIRECKDSKKKNRGCRRKKKSRKHNRHKR